MTYLEVGLVFTVPESDTDEAFEGFLDHVLEELAKIGRPEVDLTATMAERRVIFTDQVKDSGFDEAFAFFTDLRTALHSAHCGTPGWPTISEFLGLKGHDGDLAPA